MTSRASRRLDGADLLVLSVRRRAPTAGEMAAIRRYIDAGKPLVGIRTACHAFDVRGHAPDGHAEWVTFDPDVLGGHYTGHHGNGLKPKVTAVINPSGSVPVEILDGVAVPFTGQGSLYRTSPLAGSAAPLLTGTIETQPATAPEPVAWINRKGSARIFYTSLGHPADFETTAFRTLLRNAVIWALDRQPPPREATASAPSSPRPGL